MADVNSAREGLRVLPSLTYEVNMDKKRSISPGDRLPGVAGSNDMDMPLAVGFAQESMNAGDSPIKNSMTPNDGDQRDVAQPAFADGVDMRNAPKSQGSNPWPAMPGC